MRISLFLAACCLALAAASAAPHPAAAQRCSDISPMYHHQARECFADAREAAPAFSAQQLAAHQRECRETRDNNQRRRCLRELDKAIRDAAWEDFRKNAACRRDIRDCR